MDNLYHKSLEAMNTRLDMVCWGCGKTELEHAFQRIKTGMGQLELLISRYDPEAELYKLNQRGFEADFKLSQDLFQTLELCYSHYTRTKGYFDVSLGTAYHVQKKEDEVLQQKGLGFDERVLLSKEDSTARLLHKDTGLDLGGMGKGMALEQVASMLEEFDIRNAFVSFGGSSILTRGRHPHGDHWPFSLENSSIDKKWSLNDDTISVSQSQVRQTRRNHILNPKTNKPITSELTVVVQAPDPVAAEVLSTALVAAPQHEHKAIAASFPGAAYWCFVDPSRL